MENEAALGRSGPKIRSDPSTWRAQIYQSRQYLLIALPSTANLLAALSEPVSSAGALRVGGVNDASLPFERTISGSCLLTSASRSD